VPELAAPEATVPIKTAPEGPPVVVPRLPRGFLPMHVIRNGVEKRHGAVRGCWKPYLKTFPMSEPRVQVRFVIDPKGRIESAEVTYSNMNSPNVEKCVVDIVKALRFPPPEAHGYITVTYPFMAKPPGG